MRTLKDDRQQLDEMQETLLDVDTGVEIVEIGLDKANAKLDHTNRVLVSTVRAIWGLGLSVMTLAVMTCLGSPASPCVMPGLWTRFAGSSSNAAQMGKNQPTELSIPEQPSSEQKRPPCLLQAGEEEIKGACYQRTDIRPPCGPVLFRNGDRCYRGIEANPPKPSSVEPGPETR